MDLTSWLLWFVVWAVLFTGVVYLLYRLLPVWSARRGSGRTAAGGRRCPSCGGEVSSSSALCPSCGVNSTPWIKHRGSWWRREPGDVYLWLDEKKGEWRRYRRMSACPYCGVSMAVHERKCRECGRESNPLEHPDPLSDFPEEVEIVES